jgi:hypothetical protein
MAHFAQLDENNIVLTVNVVNNAVLGDTDFPESEPIGQAFMASLGLGGVWKQCSYNASFRAAYPGVGWTYDPENDVFVAPVVEEEVVEEDAE